MGVLPCLLPGIGSPPIIGWYRQKEKQRFARKALGKLPVRFHPWPGAIRRQARSQARVLTRPTILARSGGDELGGAVLLNCVGAVNRFVGHFEHLPDLFTSLASCVFRRMRTLWQCCDFSCLFRRMRTD
jgi:hypothetical protein